MNLELLYKLIKRFEGCRLTPYLCPAGVWTCGWGSTGKDVFPGRPWTQAYADERLEQDAHRFAKGALGLCPTLLGDDRKLAAIADFAYNLGLGSLKASTLRKRVNARDWDAAQYEIKRWNKSGGKVLKGLVTRRAAEAELLK
jgi:lysozyme